MQTQKYVPQKGVYYKDKLIGIIAKGYGDKVYLSLEVMVTGIDAGLFRVKDVKLTIDRLPIGQNGFKFSALPRLDASDPDVTFGKLGKVLESLVESLECEVLGYRQNTIGMMCTYTVKVSIPELELMGRKMVEEVDRLLLLYYKLLPEEMSDFSDEVKGQVLHTGKVLISARKGLW